MIDPPGLSGDELSCTEASCCIKIVSRSDVKRFLLEETLEDASPSLMQMLLCHCGPPARKDSGIDKVRQIAALAGATLQRGLHGTSSQDFLTRSAALEQSDCALERRMRGLA